MPDSLAPRPRSRSTRALSRSGDLTAPRATEADLRALAVGVGLAAVLLSPVRHYFSGDAQAKNRHDSFPLSTYPMFSEDRKGRAWVPHVVGRTATGERILPHYGHFGPGGLNQVRKQIARMVRAGQAEQVAQRYADSLAADHTRSARGRTPGAARRRREREIVRVEVVRSRFDFDDYFLRGRERPTREHLKATCAVGGTAVNGQPQRSDQTEGVQP